MCPFGSAHLPKVSYLHGSWKKFHAFDGTLCRCSKVVFFENFRVLIETRNGVERSDDVCNNDLMR